jgi:uncharacterized protein YdeI (YjbR/CyaY-like superfamily)
MDASAPWNVSAPGCAEGLMARQWQEEYHALKPGVWQGIAERPSFKGMLKVKPSEAHIE